MEIVHGEPSFRLSSPELELHITARGGHLAPVVFHLPGGDASPYALAPWEPAEYPEIPPLLSVLRGDFLCLPFGGQSDGPPHGDPANAEWHLVSSTSHSLILEMDAVDSGAHVEKILTLREGHHAIYIEHRISGLDGDYSYGNHPILDLSGLADGAGRISVSPFKWASVYPGVFSDPAAGETQALAPAATFDDLTAVPLASGSTSDLTRYPSRPGNDDLVMMASIPATAEQPFAWSAAVFDGYLWFSLKNPSQFPSTALWMSNGGRSSAPWNGRHSARIGIEEICSHFSDGVDKSRQNSLAAQGVSTTRRFRPDETVSLAIVQAVAPVPADFGKVVGITPKDDSTVTVTGGSGAVVVVTIDWKFVI